MHSIIEVRRTGWGPSKHLPKLRENQSTQISWFVIRELRNRNLISLGRWPWARHKLPISVGGSPCYWSHYSYIETLATMPPIMLSTWYTTRSASGDAVFRAGTSSRHVGSGAGTLQFCTLLSRLAWIHWPGALVSDYFVRNLANSWHCTSFVRSNTFSKVWVRERDQCFIVFHPFHPKLSTLRCSCLIIEL